MWNTNKYKNFHGHLSAKIVKILHFALMMKLDYFPSHLAADDNNSPRWNFFLASYYKCANIWAPHPKIGSHTNFIIALISTFQLSVVQSIRKVREITHLAEQKKGWGEDVSFVNIFDVNRWLWLTLQVKNTRMHCKK